MSDNLRLQLSRIIKTSRKRVFEAWTKPELLMQWFGPGEMRPVEAMVDPRPEGAMKFVIQGISPRSGQETTLTFTGTFREVIDDERISFDWCVAGDPGDPTLVTVEFKDVDEGTEVVLTQEKIWNEDLMNRNKMGWGGMLEKLASISAAA